MEFPYTRETCPDKKQHTSCPNGYVAWFEWSYQMSKTHKQIRCKTCNLFTIWVKKKKAKES